MLCCPHPDPTHDLAGDCTILHCGCHRVSIAVRCACPYNDCATLVPDLGGVCPPCAEVCVVAHGLER